MNNSTDDKQDVPVLEYGTPPTPRPPSRAKCIILTWVPGYIGAVYFLWLRFGDAPDHAKYALLGLGMYLSFPLSGMAMCLAIYYLFKHQKLRLYALIGIVLNTPTAYVAWVIFTEG